MTNDEINKFLDEMERPWTNQFEIAAWKQVLTEWDLAAAASLMVDLHATKAPKDICPADFNPEVTTGGKHGEADAAWAWIQEQAKGVGLRQLRVDLRDDDRAASRALLALTPNDLLAKEADTKWAFINAYERFTQATAAAHVTGLGSGAPALNGGAHSDNGTVES